MFQDYYRNKNNLGLRYAALAAHDLGKKLEEDERVPDNKKTPGDVKAFWESLQEIQLSAPIHHLQVVCDYALLANRRSEHE